MNKSLIALLLLCYYVPAMAQLKCKTAKTKDGGSQQTCLHENGKVSTSETWDSEKRSGNIKVYDHTGKELLNYSLRTFAGHASIELRYHGNGQVSRAEYRSAPDAGIQYYHLIYTYDENGHETSKTDLSYPNTCQPPIVYTVDTMPGQKKEEVKPTVSIEKKKDFTTVYVLVNETRSKLEVKFKSQSPLVKDTLVHLKSKETMALDTVKLDKFTEPGIYQPEIIKTRKTRNYKIIAAMPVEAHHQKIFTWYIIKEE